MTKQIRICCDDLQENLYQVDGKTWGIGLSKHISYNGSWKPENQNVLCVLYSDQCSLFDIKYCPYCGKQLHLVEAPCNHEIEKEEDND